MRQKAVELIWKRSDPWAKKLGAPRQEIMGEFWSADQAHCFIPTAREQLLTRCKTDEEREEIKHGSWWTQETQKVTV